MNLVVSYRGLFEKSRCSCVSSLTAFHGRLLITGLDAGVTLAATVVDYNIWLPVKIPKFSAELMNCEIRYCCRAEQLLIFPIDCFP